MKILINGKEVEIADEDITKAIEDKQESITVDSDKLVLRTSEEDETFKNNIRTEGQTTGIEIGRKNIIKALGIEGEGLHKTDDTAKDAINNFIQGKVTTAIEEAGAEPDKKVKELQNDIKTLQGTIQTVTGERDQIKGQFDTFKNNQLKTNAISAHVPENTVIPKADMLTIMQTQIKTDVNENGVVFGVGPDGQPLKDKTTLEVLPIKTVVDNFFNDNRHFLTKATGGAGGTDEPGGGGKQSLEEFTKEMAEAGHAANSPAFTAEMQNRIKAGTLAI